MRLTCVSLFSGIGGLDLAWEWAGGRTVAFVERDEYCRAVLAAHWPGVPQWDDVADFGAKALGDSTQLFGNGCEHHSRGSRESTGEIPEPRDADCFRHGITLLTAGFPCQPHSVAGKRQASRDERDLWGETARCVAEIRPRWFVGENVYGLLSSESGRFFSRVLGDLVEMGYCVGWGVWGAVDVGALHRRNRVFIIGYLPDAIDSRPSRQRERNAGGVGEEGRGVQEAGSESPVFSAPCGTAPTAPDVADAESDGAQRLRTCREQVASAPGGQELSGRGGGVIDSADGPAFGRLGHLADGLPRWLASPDGSCWQAEPHDVPRVTRNEKARVHKLRSLGNAVVPQQAYPLLQAIADYERSRR